MSAWLERIQTVPTRYLVVLILLLFFPAHLIHLGIAPFNGDEAIRALVALEMDLSGNYIATTMHGNPYINKPPLFNWILLVFFKLFGYFGEYPARSATVFFLIVYAWMVYRFTRREFGNEFGFLSALMVVTCGRLLLYDSMLGLIDTTFSVVIYTLFMSIYYYGNREKWQQLFLAGYSLMAIGFLLKGLPAFVFQGLSLTAGLLFFKQGRRLFSSQHILGMLLAGCIIGGYLLAYAQYRSLDVFLPNLMEESVKRTAVVHRWWQTVEHLVRFPFDSVYHFLPFSLLILAWVDRHFWQRLQENKFVLFNFILLAVNLPVYWSSAQVYARYLLMFVPLFIVMSFYLMEQKRAAGLWQYRLFYYLLGGLAILLPLTFLTLPFVPEVNFLPGIWPLSLSFGGLLALSATGYFADRKRYLYWMITSLLIARLAFDFIILPVRHHTNEMTVAKRDVYQLIEKYPGRTWYLYGKSDFRETASFYSTQQLGYIFRYTDDLNKPKSLYFVNPKQYPNPDSIFQSRPVDTLQTDYAATRLFLYTRE